MFGKTPITALQEYCAKKGLEKPVYNCIEASDGSKTFICRVEALNDMADGIGRSKKEAKHDAAANIIKRLKYTHPDIEDIPQAPHEIIPISDAIADLRDLCLQQDHPLPSFEIIQQAGPPEAPEFTAECCVATIKRFGKASTKKAAKQKAAQQIITIIRDILKDNAEQQIISLTDATEQQKEENKNKIKTYREYVESDIKIIPGTLLSNRHNYFKNFNVEIKDRALQILSEDMFSDKNKFDDLMSALQIKYKTQTIPSTETEGIIFIELICDFDCVFAGTVYTVYSDILSYFKDMLV